MADTATRYSGSAVISVRYDERDDDYTARIKNRIGETYKVEGLGMAPADRRTIAADSAEAFDKIANAALSFAENMGGFNSGADHNGSGWVVSRRKSSRKIPKVPAGVRRASR